MNMHRTTSTSSLCSIETVKASNVSPDCIPWSRPEITIQTNTTVAVTFCALLEATELPPLSENALSTLKKISKDADALEAFIPGHGKSVFVTVHKGLAREVPFDVIPTLSDDVKGSLGKLIYDDKKALAVAMGVLFQASKDAGLSSPTSSISEDSAFNPPVGLRQTLSDSLPPRISSKPRIQFDNLPNDAESTSSPKFRIGGDLSTITGLEDITLATRASSSHNSAKILEPIVPKSGSHLSTTDQASDAGESSVGDGKSDASSDEGKDITTPSTSGEDIYSDDKEEENECDCLCTLM